MSVSSSMDVAAVAVPVRMGSRLGCFLDASNDSLLVGLLFLFIAAFSPLPVLLSLSPFGLVVFGGSFGLFMGLLFFLDVRVS